MKKNLIFIGALVASLAGLGLGVLWPQVIDWEVSLSLGIGFLGLGMVLKNGWKAAFIWVGIFCLAWMRVWWVPHFISENEVAWWNNPESEVEIWGVICEEEDPRHVKSKYVVCVEKIKMGEEEREVTGKVMVTLRKWPAFLFGDEVKLFGILEAPFVSEEFDYEKYLERFGIRSEMRYAVMEKTGERKMNWAFSKILEFKRFYAGVIAKVFPEPEAAFLDGLLRGAKKGLPEEIFEEFQKTGLTHIIAVSGFNITIIAAAMMAVFGRISKKWGVMMTLLGIVGFVIFTGMSAAVVRAGIMGGIAAFAVLTGRQAHAVTALLLAGAVMAWWQPLVIGSDVGWQLSFLATFGLIFVAPFLEKGLKWVPEEFGLKEAFLLTISAQILVVPLIAWQFERISLIAPLTNVLVAPFIVLAMGFGFAGLVAGMFSTGLGMFVGIPAMGALSVMLGVAHWGAKVGWADFEMGISLWGLGIYYLGLGGLLIWLWVKWKPEVKKLEVGEKVKNVGK